MSDEQEPSTRLRATWRGLIAVVLPLLAVAPLLYAARIGILLGLPDQVIDGDGALCELALRSGDPTSLEGPLVGAYSRLGFHHPGPLHYLLLAPIHALGGSTVLAMTLAAGVLQTVLLAWSIAVVRRAAGFRASFIVAVATLLHIHLHGSQLFSVWEPAIARTALWATLVGAFAAFRGRSSGLWLTAFAGSLAMQAHLGVVAPVLLAWAASALILRHGGMARHIRSIVGVTALIFACWLPPLLEQTGIGPSADIGLDDSSRGNVNRILAELGGDRDTIPAGEAIGHAMSATTADTAALFGIESQAAPLFLIAAHLLGLGVLLWQARVRRSSLLLGLAGVGLILHIATLLASLRIVGSVPDHLLAFGGLAAVPLWIGALSALLTLRLPRETKWLRTAVFVVLAGGAAWLGHGSSQRIGGNILQVSAEPGLFATPGLGATLPLLFANLDAQEIESIQLVVPREADRLIEAGLVNSWDKRGLRVAPDPRSLWLYPGTRLRQPLETPDARIVLGPQREGALPLTPNCYVTIERD